jgi:hypothetical protein
LESVYLLRKVESDSVPLESLAITRDGVNPGPKVFRERILNPSGPEKSTWRPFIEGRHVRPFQIKPSESIIDYDPELLTEDLRKQGSSFRNPTIFDAPKLVNRQTANTLIFALDDAGYCSINSVHNTRAIDGDRSTLVYLLGLLNSRLLRFYYRQHSQETRKVFPQVHIATLRQLPMRPIDWSNPRDAKTGSRIIEAVERLMTLNQALEAANTSQESVVLLHQVKATERHLDQTVYELYDLTEAEVAVVELSSGNS